MSRGNQNKLYRTFVKGIITEAGPLTYPENASTDELNTILKRKGSRSRRFGMDYEPESTAVNVDGFDSDAITSEFHWKSVGNDSEFNLLCVQIGSVVKFFDTSQTPITTGLQAFEIDLLDYKMTDVADALIENSRVQMTSGKGFLFIAHQYMEPLIVEYDSDAENIEIQKVVIQMRDFDGVSDTLANDEEPTTLTKEHFYNLRNQGWVGPGSSAVGPAGGEAVPAPPSYGDPGYYNPWSGDFNEYDPVAP